MITLETPAATPESMKSSKNPSFFDMTMRYDLIEKNEVNNHENQSCEKFKISNAYYKHDFRKRSYFHSVVSQFQLSK